MDIHPLLSLGLEPAEAKIYVAALELGETLPKRLAEKAGIKRPTLYVLLPRLLQKGLLSETRRGKRRFLVAEDPEAYWEQRKAELDQFEDVIPALRSLLSSASTKPLIGFYEGIEGVKKVYLDNLRAGQPLLDFIGLSKIHPDIDDYANNYYIRERVRRKLPLQILISGAVTYRRSNLVSSPKALREVRIVDGKLFPCPLDICIYGTNVSFIIYREDSSPAGVIIRSKEISVGMRSLFNLAWLLAQPDAPRSLNKDH